MKLTIFTPTYNRGYIIEKLYTSLKNQTVKDFQWVVVDDGSTDNTEDLFKKWEAEDNGFPITYLKKANGGKHRAINCGVTLALGELFFIVDSDDRLTPDAVEKIIRWEQTLHGKQQPISGAKGSSHMEDDVNAPKFAGVAGNRGYSEDTIIGETFQGEYCDATQLERREKNILGDKAEIFYTDILRKYPFPEIAGERFITEAVVWNKIAHDGYKIRWFNEIIYIGEYLADGLTSTGRKNYINNPKGYGISIAQDVEFRKMSPLKAMYTYYLYYRDMKNILTFSQIAENLGVSKAYLTLVAFLGLGFQFKP